MIITIDGPCGVGKSTISRGLAANLGFGQLDSGALYRAVTLHCLLEDVDFSDPDQLAKAAETAEIDMQPSEKGDIVLLNGKVVNERLRDTMVTRRIAPIADMRPVRERVNAVQRKMAKGRNLVLDGRDTGTVVFPDADIKFFLTADLKERAIRRHQQMIEQRGHENTESLDVVIEDVKARDQRDRDRPYGALRQAEDAILFDSTGLEFDQTLEKLTEIVKSHPAWSEAASCAT